MMTKKYSDGDDDSFYYGFSDFCSWGPSKYRKKFFKRNGWSGYHNTHFWNPRQELFALVYDSSKRV